MAEHGMSSVDAAIAIPGRPFLKAAETLFWIVGLALLGWCTYVWVDARLYQARQERALEAFESARPATPERPAASAPAASASASEAAPDVPRAEAPPAPLDLAAERARVGLDPLVIGKIELPRLRVAAIVREGDDDETLRRAVGHIPGTALPDQGGNFAVAGHRDTFFRGLRKVKRNDVVVMKTLLGSYKYKVFSTRIVKPSDVDVLEPQDEELLTMVTCFPFDFVGHAPKRFVVQARRVP
jgi:sortase A